MGDSVSGCRRLEGCGEIRDRLNGRILKGEKRRDYTLDVDATQIEAMKREAAWTYKGVRGGPAPRN